MGLSSSTARPDQDNQSQSSGSNRIPDPHLRNLDRPELSPQLTGMSGRNRIEPSATAEADGLRPVDLDPDTAETMTESVAEFEDETRTLPPAARHGLPLPEDHHESDLSESLGHQSQPLSGISGTAWLSGRTLRFPDQTSLIPGKPVELSGRVYEIQTAKNLSLLFWLRWGGLGVLVLLAILGTANLFVGPPEGSVTGVVINRITGKVIGSATVQVKDGPVVRTNAAGLYVADGLAEGLFELTAAAFGYENQSGTVTRSADKQAHLAFALLPLVIDSAESEIGDKSAQQASTEVIEEDRPKIAYGHITLEVGFKKYLVFVDNILYGKNTEKIKRLTAGKHKIILQVEGYEDYSRIIDVKARKTDTLKVAKASMTPKVDPIKRARSHFANAKEHLDRGLWQKAIAEYDRGLEYEPDDPRAIQYRGWAYSKSGDTENAQRDYRAAATIHGDANRYLDAVACAGYLIELKPKSAEPYRRRAEYYLALKEYRKAIDDYKAAVKHEKSSASLRLGLAEAYFVAGKFKDAAKEFDRARKLVDDPTDIYVRMLISLTRSGEDRQLRKKYKAFTEFADPEHLEDLRQNPEWLRVLQIVDPLERSDG